MNRREFLNHGALAVAGVTATRDAHAQPSRSAHVPAALDGPTALRLAREKRDELVALLTQLVAVSSPLGESAEPAQRAVSAYLDARGYRSDLVTDDPTAYTSHPDYMAPATPYPAPAVNLIARAGQRPSRVGLFAHIDTERAGNGWTSPPLEARVRDGRLYGLGAADDKGGVAAMAVAATLLHAQGRPAPIVMSLHGKGGGSRGSLPTFARLKDFSQVLYVHPAETGRGFADIKHIVRGVLDMRLTVTGWRGTARELGSPDSASFSEGGDALQAALAIIDDWRGGTLKGCEVNVGELTAGDRVGSVPASARARVRVLFDDARSFGDILAATRRDAERVATARGKGTQRITVTLERDGLGANHAAVPWDSPACQALRTSIADVTGTAPASYPTHFAGDIRYPIRLAGVPAFGMGSLAGGFYGADEWVDIDDLVRLVAVVMLCADRWARLA